MNSIYFYSAILIAVLVHWGYMRFVLSRGYSAAFMKARRTANLERLFEEHKTILYMNAAFCLILLGVVIAAAKVLSNLKGLNHWIDQVVCCSIIMMYGKDLFYFNLVKFVLERESVE
jgi:hypothetical protein